MLSLRPLEDKFSHIQVGSVPVLAKTPEGGGRGALGFRWAGHSGMHVAQVCDEDPSPGFPACWLCDGGKSLDL